MWSCTINSIHAKCTRRVEWDARTYRRSAAGRLPDVLKAGVLQRVVQRVVVSEEAPVVVLRGREQAGVRVGVRRVRVRVRVRQGVAVGRSPQQRRGV